MKKIMILFVGLLSTSQGIAQDNSAKTFLEDPFNHPMMPFYLVMALVFIVLVLLVVVTLIMLRVVNMFIEETERKKARELGKEYVPKPSWWTSLMEKFNASVPVAQEKDIELDHNYDGIKELDNHLPPWWKWLFYGTIGWAAIYLVVFHFSDTLPLSQAEYENEIAKAEEQIRQYQARQPQATIDVESLKYTPDVEIIGKGKSVFMNNNCGSCHRIDGGGNAIGPNLTDVYWIHGGNVKNIFNTVKNGVVDKGMPAWGRSLSPTEVRDVAFYILSLQGTNPVGAKAPQGELFKMEVTISDSTKVQASL